MPKYSKVRFTTTDGSAFTAGLVLLDSEIKRLGMVGISKMFPRWECVKMHKVQFSPSFDTWDAAFKYQFDGV